MVRFPFAGVQDSPGLTAGAQAAARLKLLDDVYGLSTRRNLLDGGLRSGMRVLDMGCGLGTLACWMAARVGPKGCVVTADESPDQLALARETWAACGDEQPVQFMEASAYATGMPARSFDLVHCRLLLCHLSRPEEALREFHRLLKPGGTLVCQELFVSSLFASPRSQAFQDFVTYARDLERTTGTDCDFGLKLCAAATRVGFKSPEVRLDQPAFLRGPWKRLWEWTATEWMSRSVAGGAIGQHRADAILAGMRRAGEDETTLIGQAALIGIIARK